MKSILKNIFLKKYSVLAVAIILFILSFFFNTIYSDRSSVAREVKIAEKYLAEKQKDFNTFLKDSALINRLLKDTVSLNEFTSLSSKQYGIFLFTRDIFENPELKFWSEQLVVPDDNNLALNDGEFFLQLSNGYYYVIKKTLSYLFKGQQIISFAFIPVESKFFIETEYLPEELVYSKEANKRVLISDTITEFPVKTVSGKHFFTWIKKKSGLFPTMTT